MTKKNLVAQSSIYFLGVIVAFIWVWKSRLSNDLETTVTNPEVQGSKAKPTPARAEHVKSHTTAPPTIAAIPPEQKPPEGSVPFKVVGGMAIAFGDVILGTPDDPTMTEGHFLAPRPLLWEKSEIPFLISPALPEPNRIAEALKLFATRTGLNFVPFNGQEDALVFEPTKEHCFSALGRTGGLQPIRLAASCGSKEIAHEIMHAIGFVHEQSRSDRDQYIEILWKNIDPEFRAQFEAVPDSLMEISQGAAFDYNSIMMYPASLFAAEPDLLTMKTKTQIPFATNQGKLSDADVERINRLYPKRD